MQAAIAVHDLSSQPAPGVVSCMRLNARSTVVLPHPDGPMNAVIWCAWMRRVTPRTARKLP